MSSGFELFVTSLVFNGIIAVFVGVSVVVNLNWLVRLSLGWKVVFNIICVVVVIPLGGLALWVQINSFIETYGSKGLLSGAFVLVTLFGLIYLSFKPTLLRVCRRYVCKLNAAVEAHLLRDEQR